MDVGPSIVYDSFLVIYLFFSISYLLLVCFLELILSGFPAYLSSLPHAPLTVCFHEITSLLLASLYLSHVLTSRFRDLPSCQCHFAATACIDDSSQDLHYGNSHQYSYCYCN